MTLDDLLVVQECVQRRTFEYGSLRGPELAEYIRLNVLAATDELHEVLGEVQWKPWKGDQGSINRERYVDELADALLFWANLCWAARVSGAEMTEAVHRAWAKTAERMAVTDR